MQDRHVKDTFYRTVQLASTLSSMHLTSAWL